jgi:hypothetical protein
VAVAFAQGGLETVIVKVTVCPISPATGVYVGAVVVPFVIVPPPLDDHDIVPFVAFMPLTVADPFGQIVLLPPLPVAVGVWLTVTVAVAPAVQVVAVFVTITV